MKSLYTIPIAIVVGGLIVAGTVYLSAPKKPSIDPSLIRPVDTTDHILGNPVAPVIIVEYSDFDCAYCKVFHNTLHQIIANEGARGDVAWVLRPFPLTEIHPNALALAKAAECAAETGGNESFWKLADALFANQPVAPINIGTIAASAGISGDAFATCYASESASAPLLQRIMRDRKNALDMGAQGTPYSVILIRGKAPIVMESAYSYDAVRDLIDQALSE